jgi:hypothetical protein
VAEGGILKMSVNYDVNKDALCLRYVIPFKYTISFEEAYKGANEAEINNEKIWEKNIGNEAESDLYDYVKDEFLFESAEQNDCTPSDMKMGYEWKHRSNNKHGIAEFKYLENPIRKGINVDAEMKKGLNIAISDAGLLLFRNKIGMIWYEIELRPQKEQKLSSEFLEKFQYRMREINRNEIHLLQASSEKLIGGFASGGGNGHIIYSSPMVLSYWINRQLEFLGDVHYFAERKSSYENAARNAEKIITGNKQGEENLDTKSPENFQNAADKPILFTYAMLSDENDNTENDETSMYTKEELSYHLTNGYKDSYHFSKDIVNDMKFPFGNVIWYGTEEGVSYLSWASDDNKEFFKSFAKKVKTDYFTLFIKVLYQSYSLLTYAENIQNRITAVYDKNNDDKDKNYHNITELYEEINLFLTKSMATSVSFIHHQSDFYVYLKKQFRVAEDVESVNSGLSVLEVIQREQERINNEAREKAAEKQREQERLDDEAREKAAENKLQAIMGLFALLGIGSAFVDTYDFITRFSRGSESNFWTLGTGAKVFEVIFGFIILVISALAVFFAIKAIIRAFGDNNKKKKSKIQQNDTQEKF